MANRPREPFRSGIVYDPAHPINLFREEPKDADHEAVGSPNYIVSPRRWSDTAAIVVYADGRKMAVKHTASVYQWEPSHAVVWRRGLRLMVALAVLCIATAMGAAYVHQQMAF